MKRIMIILAALLMATAANAQLIFSRNTEIELPQMVTDIDAVQDSAAEADSLWWDDHPRMSLELGLSAGVTLFADGNDNSPYYSIYGFVVNLPLTFRYFVSPRWRLGAGLRYDFCIDPLFYNVKENEVSNGGTYATNGIGFDTTPVVSHKRAYASHNYVGIPLQATWYPWPKDRGALNFTFDFFAGYSFATIVNIRTIHADRYMSSFNGNDLSSDDSTLLPWKMELGITMATDIIGLLHGIRFFVNLLPTYRDPATGDNLYFSGMTLYL